MKTKPYIIAEVGSNWASIYGCLESIRIAKECGADAVKFQLFDRQSLYGQAGGHMASSMPGSWIRKLSSAANRYGIDFMCSAFSVELLNAVDPYVKAHKVASAEMCHIRMLERLNEIGKPVYLSTGAHTVDEIRQALTYLDNCDVTLMYCTASYPAKYTDTSKINLMEKLFGRNVGFSDHTLDVVEAPWGAKVNGAVAIEKHVNFVGANGPDAAHSLSTEEFQYMVLALRPMGPELGPTPDEADMLTTHNRRLIATSDIAIGDTFKEGVNFGIYRATKATEGLSPFMIDEVNGKVSKHFLKAGDGVKLGHIHE